MPRLPELPSLAWRDGALFATDVDDLYAARAGALGQSREVFLAGCGLPDRWRGVTRAAILELGFGAGINAIAAWEAWRAVRSPGARLSFVSIEHRPMAREDAARAMAAAGAPEDLARALLAQWPVRAFGPQRVFAPEDGFELTIHIGEAAQIAPQLSGAFDSFFLDGFAPAKDPAIWSSDVMAALALRAAPGARAATYSVAAQVRGALQDAGFAVEKREGYAGKKQRLEARFEGPARALAPPPPQSVAVIGAGVAAAAFASACMRRGWCVSLVEDDAPAASGNPAALVMPRLDRGSAPLQALHVSAFVDAVRFYEAQNLFERCGVLSEDLAQALTDPPLPAAWLSPQGGAAFLPMAGLVRPPAVLASLLNGARVRRGRVASVQRADEAWRVHDAKGVVLAEAQHLVLAAGAGLPALWPDGAPQLRFLAGQVNWAYAPGALPHALAGRGYVAPFTDHVVFGATFERVDHPIAEASSQATAQNLATLARLAPAVAARLAGEQPEARAAVRLAAADMTPILGAAPNAPGLWILGALGSRGFTLAPFLAEDLAAQIAGEPGLLTPDQRRALAPDRFAARAARRLSRGAPPP